VNMWVNGVIVLMLVLRLFWCFCSMVSIFCIFFSVGCSCVWLFCISLVICLVRFFRVSVRLFFFFDSWLVIEVRLVLSWCICGLVVVSVEVKVCRFFIVVKRFLWLFEMVFRVSDSLCIVWLVFLF